MISSKISRRVDIAVIRSYNEVACLPPFVHGQTLFPYRRDILVVFITPCFLVTKGGAMEMDDELLRFFGPAI